jgi:DNA-binding CsgD family transcriptional regulator
MLQARRCRVCKATALGRDVPLLLADHRLESWHLCGPCVGHLERGFHLVAPARDLRPFLDGRGLRLTPDELRRYIAVGLEHAGDRLSVDACRVLALSATGLSIGEVADRLAMPTEDAHRHLGDAIASLGATSKLDAIVRALRQGLVTLPRA